MSVGLVSEHHCSWGKLSIRPKIVAGAAVFDFAEEQLTNLDDHNNLMLIVITFTSEESPHYVSFSL